jgi:hypothetical protein
MSTVYVSKIVPSEEVTTYYIIFRISEEQIHIYSLARALENSPV